MLGNKMAKARSISLRILLNLPDHGYWVLDLFKEEPHNRVVGRIRTNYMAFNENMPPVLIYGRLWWFIHKVFLEIL